MSGGAFDYDEHRINYVADEIERLVLRDFRRTEQHWQTGQNVEVDEIECDSKEQRELIVAEAKSLVEDLRAIYQRCKNLDYLLCGDDGPETFVNRLNVKAGCGRWLCNGSQPACSAPCFLFGI
jgi:hypothetical protein